MTAPRFDAFLTLRAGTLYEIRVRSYWTVSKMAKAGEPLLSAQQRFLDRAATRERNEPLRLCCFRLKKTVEFEGRAA